MHKFQHPQVNVMLCDACSVANLAAFFSFSGQQELHSKAENWVLWPSIPVGHNRNKPPAMHCNAGRASLHGNLLISHNNATNVNVQSSACLLNVFANVRGIQQFSYKINC